MARNNDPFNDLLRSLEENLQKEGGWVPPDDGRQRRQAQGNPRRILWVLIPLLIILFFNRIVGYYTDFIWFESLGLGQVFVTRLLASVGLFVVGALTFWLFLALNVWIARRIEPMGLASTPVEEFAQAIGLRVTTVVLAAGAVVAVLMGLSAASAWEALLVFLNQRPYGLADPLFGLDVSFFLFTLPVWEALRTWLMTLLVFTLIATALVSGMGWRGWRIRTPVLAHLALLGAVVLLLVAWQYRLDALNLVYSNRGAVFGAGYADVNAQLPAYNLLSLITLATAALLVVMVFLRRAWRAMVALLGVWLVLGVLAGNVYPGLIQRFQVTPNELSLERPFIQNNIDFTRAAFDLDSIEVRSYEVSPRLPVSDLLREADTVRNVRLWDYRPLLQTYNQIQALRQYYAFNDIDVDRYVIDGEVRQVMLAARELVPERLSEDAQTWVNRRLVYTHGYGVAASPVAQVTRDGLPDFYVKDLPPQGVIPVTQPQIYFGELANDYVIGRTDEPEFDYPRGDGNVTSSFSANTGIEMSLWHRLVFAVRFADINLLLNRDIRPDSQLLWRRNIVDRVTQVAPFLRYDRDPYIVIAADGRLYWLLDAYTVSNRFPYSEPMGAINYIRNSVKVVISAYDGSMRFFMVDEAEPVVAAYARIFPVLFAPMHEMPEDLRRHIRYPNDLFTVQAEVYRTYHMTNPTDFYNREDLWAWPEEIFQDQTQRMEPYYVLMRLPGEEQLEYVQILPFTPANRENMIAWLAARSDPEHYGGKLVYEFGKDSLFFGPKQVEARIDQNPIISAQLALWNQQGSSVIRGNLLVIPLGGSLLYVEPLYLQASSGRIPELQRVIVATADQVAMAPNLGLALAEIFGNQVLTDGALDELVVTAADLDAGAAPPSAVNGPALTLEELIVQANAHFNRAQAAAQAGRWAEYGEELAALEETLAALANLAGVPVVPPAGEEEPAQPEPPTESAPVGQTGG